MSADTRTVGYPVHRLAAFAVSANVHGAIMTRWRAACGRSDTYMGRLPHNTAGQARAKELCTDGCWPSGMRGYYPDPVDESEVPSE